ncbi:hypothetical protein [Leuconostoc mesenteroides]|uniref:hypothetical protein n=1 Tax=Leuconostoc mesenteroides TaxID=1245 RepID=UPI00236277F0|nr:hypothetical protein [Leuconostoc mesenteroides]
MLDNKNKLELTARNYKERLEQVTISDSDIESLHNTVSIVLKIIKPLSQSGEQEDEKSIDIVLDLLNSDTLKTLQLLGYNYKKAIGEPLTQITAEFLKAKLDTKK